MLAVKEQEFTSGIYDISNEEYHASTGISKSGISKFKKSPKHYWDAYLNPNKPPREDKKAWVVGSAVHTLLLEPENFNFVVEPKFDKRTNIGKELFKKFQEFNQGKEFISQDDFNAVLAIIDSITAHPLAGKMIAKDAEIEKSFYWIDEGSGMLCKSRPDIWIGNTVIELKSTSDASEQKFSSSIYNYDYYLQAPMQIDGIEANTELKIDLYIYVAVETERPYPVGIYILDEEAINYGREQYKQHLMHMRRCFDKNHWPDYASDFKKISLPNYAYYQGVNHA